MLTGKRSRSEMSACSWAQGAVGNEQGGSLCTVPDDKGFYREPHIQSELERGGNERPAQQGSVSESHPGPHFQDGAPSFAPSLRGLEENDFSVCFCWWFYLFF